MSANTLLIRKLSRSPEVMSSDTLVFKQGVNLIVGEKDSGKTKWLSMLDYLMGETDKPENVFGDDLAKKYDSVTAEVEIAGETVKLERRWKEEGAKTKVWINGAGHNSAEFSEFLLGKLNIPMLKFPRGNPWAERAWSSLSWRMLLRHVYRQERFWTDFADKQPLCDQHACIAQFLSVATALFPSKLGELIQKQKELEATQAQKDAHISLLNAITAELVQHREMTVGVTEDALTVAEARLNAQLQDLERRRTDLLENVQKQVHRKLDAETDARRSRLQQLTSDQERISRERAQLERREGELGTYLGILKAELERMARAKASGEVLADLRVTHCPVCDQEVGPVPPHSGTCFLCSKPLPPADTPAAVRRITFEEDQLTEEVSELESLLSGIRGEMAEMGNGLVKLAEAIRRIESELLAARQVAATLIPEDLVLIDRDSGRFNEQLAFLKRVRKTLDIQKTLSAQIDACQREEARLKAELASEVPDVNLEEVSELFQTRMVDYLNKINIGDARRWSYGPVMFRLRQHDFQVRVKGGTWNAQTGATSQALVLFAYHYAMLSLVADGKFNYPGLVIIDFPLELADGASVADKENYLVEPFIELCARKGMESTQFIAAGRSFANLKGSHQVPLVRE